jgi:hypothetical protein
MAGSWNQTGGSRVSVRFVSRTWPRRWSWLSLACALTVSCSALLEVSEKQCVVDSDCLARGLTNTSCVANLCRPMVPAANTAGAQGNAMSGTGGKDSAGTGGKGGTDSIDTGGPNAVVMDAGSGAGGTSGGAAGKSGTGGSGGSGGSGGMSGGGAGSGGAAGCAGASCGECSDDLDCQERLGANATCVDRTCFGRNAECEKDEDCVGRGPEFMGGRCANKQCLPNPKWRCEPTPIGEPTAMIDLTLPIIDALALTYVSNIALVACNKLDYMCEQPVAKATSNMDGRATFSVPANFAGYIQQKDNTGYGPGLYFMPAQLPPKGEELKNFPIFRTGSTALLAVGLGAPLDPQRGHMMLVAEDCMGNSIAGVAFSTPQADDKSVQFYVRDQTPTTSAMDTPPAGTGGFMNLPAGVAVITAKEVKTGLELSQSTVLIRAGYISMLYIRPPTRGETTTGVGGH